MSMIASSLLNEMVNEKGITQPGAILDTLRKGIIKVLAQSGNPEEAKEGLDIALCSFDQNSSTLEYAGAFNPMYFIRNQQLTDLKADKQPIGIYPGKQNTPFTNHTMDIHPGDAVYIFTDGFADQFGGPEGKKFRYKPFQELLLSIQPENIATQQSLLQQAFDTWRGEPNQKVVLGSKYPTFIISHKKGWNNLLTSDIDFDYLEIGIEQNLLLGTLGNSRYAFTAGKFVNTSDLRYVDLKRFRQSDPYLYSDPLHSFQLLDTSLSATNLFLEAHYIHHFNGAMINNLPLIKKTKIRTVVGAGAMWIKQSNYRYEEVFGGIERVFKLGARRRLRLGIYGVLSQTNHRAPATGYKISFDIIDTWKREWSY